MSTGSEWVCGWGKVATKAASTQTRAAGSAGEVGGAGSLQGLSLKLRNLHFILND